jgi:(2R)-3-sulfolactate dehydrogenase (NADP+)
MNGGPGLRQFPGCHAGGRGGCSIFGTNPVAAIFPRRGADPLMIDLSLSEVARGKLMVAAQQGPTPQGPQAAS